MAYLFLWGLQSNRRDKQMNNCHTLIWAVINSWLLPLAEHNWPVYYLLLFPFAILQMNITLIFLGRQIFTCVKTTVSQTLFNWSMFNQKN